MWTKMKTTTGMTKDSLAGGERRDVVITGTVFWSSETNRVWHNFIETWETTRDLRNLQPKETKKKKSYCYWSSVFVGLLFALTQRNLSVFVVLLKLCFRRFSKSDGCFPQTRLKFPVLVIENMVEGEMHLKLLLWNLEIENLYFSLYKPISHRPLSAVQHQTAVWDLISCENHQGRWCLGQEQEEAGILT